MDPEIVALIIVFTIFRFPAVANKPRGQLKNTPHYIVLYTNHAGSAFIKFANPPRRGPAPRGIFFLGPPRLAASIGAGISRSGLFPGKVGVPRLGSPEGGDPPWGQGGHNFRSVLPCRSGPAPQIRAEFPLSSALSIMPGATNPGRISAQFCPVDQARRHKPGQNFRGCVFRRREFAGFWLRNNNKWND